MCDEPRRDPWLKKQDASIGFRSLSRNLLQSVKRSAYLYPINDTASTNARKLPVHLIPNPHQVAEKYHHIDPPPHLLTKQHGVKGSEVRKVGDLQSLHHWHWGSARKMKRGNERGGVWIHEQHGALSGRLTRSEDDGKLPFFVTWRIILQVNCKFIVDICTCATNYTKWTTIIRFVLNAHRKVYTLYLMHCYLKTGHFNHNYQSMDF